MFGDSQVSDAYLLSDINLLCLRAYTPVVLEHSGMPITFSLEYCYFIQML